MGAVGSFVLMLGLGQMSDELWTTVYRLIIIFLVTGIYVTLIRIRAGVTALAGAKKGLKEGGVDCSGS